MTEQTTTQTIERGDLVEFRIRPANDGSDPERWERRSGVVVSVGENGAYLGIKVAWESGHGTYQIGCWAHDVISVSKGQVLINTDPVLAPAVGQVVLFRAGVDQTHAGIVVSLWPNRRGVNVRVAYAAEAELGSYTAPIALDRIIRVGGMARVETVQAALLAEGFAADDVHAVLSSLVSAGLELPYPDLGGPVLTWAEVELARKQLTAGKAQHESDLSDATNGVVMDHKPADLDELAAECPVCGGDLPTGAVRDQVCDGCYAL